MPHFASSIWPNDYGFLGGGTATVLCPAATATGSTEGTDQFTFMAPTTGLYRCSVQAIVLVQANGTTSIASPVVTYTDVASTKSAVAMSAATLDNKGTVGTTQIWQVPLRLIRLGTLVVQLKHTVSGTNSAGSVIWTVSVEKIAD